MAKKPNVAAARSARDEGEEFGEEVPESSQASNRSAGIALGIVTVMGVGLYVLKPQALSLHAEAISHATSFLAVAVVVSLFMERAIEVFVGVWRNPTLVGLEAELERIAQRLKDSKEPDEAARLQSEQHRFNLLRAQYKVGTQRFALRASFCAGLLLSVAGLRCLEGLAADVSSLPSLQQFLFHFVDVLLTGGLIAGGSDGLHKIAQVYSTMIDTTNKRLRDGSQGAAATMVTSSSSSLTSTSTTSASVTPATSGSPSAPATTP